MNKVTCSAGRVALAERVIEIETLEDLAKIPGVTVRSEIGKAADVAHDHAAHLRLASPEAEAITFQQAPLSKRSLACVVFGHKNPFMSRPQRRGSEKWDGRGRLSGSLNGDFDDHAFASVLVGLDAILQAVPPIRKMARDAMEAGSVAIGNVQADSEFMLGRGQNAKAARLLACVNAIGHGAPHAMG
jgi:hypothetical protein